MTDEQILTFAEQVYEDYCIDCVKQLVPKDKMIERLIPKIQILVQKFEMAVVKTKQCRNGKVEFSFLTFDVKKFVETCKKSATVKIYRNKYEDYKNETCGNLVTILYYSLLEYFYEIIKVLELVDIFKQIGFGHVEKIFNSDVSDMMINFFTIFIDLSEEYLPGGKKYLEAEQKFRLLASAEHKQLSNN